MTAFVTKSVLCASPFGFHRMAYSDWGAREGAKPILCVHGLTRNGRDFDYLAADLVSRGYRVICPDVVGRGRSDWLAAGAAYAVPQYIADMTCLLAAEGLDRVAWFGTSMGGLIGMAMAAMSKSPIESLMLNDVGPFIPKAALERIGDYVGVTWRFTSFEQALEHVKKAYEPFGLTREEDWVELARNSLREEPDPESGAQSWVNNFDIRIADPFKAGPIVDVDMWSIWDRIDCPVWGLRGVESDLLKVETVAEMSKRGPGVTMLDIPGCGHAPALMEESQLFPVRDWLQSTWSE